MSEFKIVPGAPFAHWQANQARGESNRLEGHFLFSYARHAMISFLRFLRQSPRAKKRISDLRILMPKYMCHEVIQSLLPEVNQISYYSVNEDFAFDLNEIEARLERGAFQVLMVSHLYGKQIRCMKELRSLCDQKEVFLIEDSAHLPPFFLQNEPPFSHAQIYTYRKLFGISYGASMRIEGALKQDFDQFYRNSEKIPEARGWVHYFEWLARDRAKRLIVSSGLEIKRSYQELGIDPLKDFNQVSLPVERALRHLQTSNYVRVRRKNAQALTAFFKTELPQWKILNFDPAFDVPYQFLFYKDEAIDSIKIINQFLARGVALVKGLELLPQNREEFGKSHAFNNQLALPVHQDVTHGQLEHIIKVCRQVKF